MAARLEGILQLQTLGSSISINSVQSQLGQGPTKKEVDTCPPPHLRPSFKRRVLVCVCVSFACSVCATRTHPCRTRAPYARTVRAHRTRALYARIVRTHRTYAPYARTVRKNCAPKSAVCFSKSAVFFAKSAVFFQNLLCFFCTYGARARWPYGTERAYGVYARCVRTARAYGARVRCARTVRAYGARAACVAYVRGTGQCEAYVPARHTCESRAQSCFHSVWQR